ncbi:MAG: hypothetical protein H6609_20050 [Ignavibacteriales bacterium]|nr:hypothetical protein [Ignavibacteriales bacterium]
MVNGQARDIFEDSKGYIWFATNGGVSRWDGETFLNFTERTGLTSAYVFDIAEAPDGTIYFASFGINGINTFKDGKLDTLFNEGENKLTFLTIIHFTKDSSLIMGAADGIYLFKNKTLLNLNELYEIPAETMHNLDTNSKGEVFISTSSGIVKVSGNRLTIEYGYDGGNDDYVSVLAIDKNDNLFFTNEHQFLVKENDMILPVNEKYNFLSNKVNDIIFSEDNIGYIATNEGLSILDKNRNLSFITKENGLSNNKPYKIFESENGTIFIASAIANIDIYIPGKLDNFSQDNGLPDNNVFNIYVDKNMTEFLGTGDGLLIRNKKTNKIISPKIKDGYTNFISFAEMNNNVYAGTEVGIDIIENGEEKNFFKLKKIRNVKHNESNRIFSLAALNDSTLLAGTYKGVYKFVKDSIFLITKNDGLLSNYVSKIVVLKDKSIVYGYHEKGISIVKNGNYKHYTIENGLSGNGIADICEYAKGTILVGIEQGGVNIIKNGIIDTITIEDGLTNNDIRAIAKDDLGNVYVTTSVGLNIIKFNEENFTIRTITNKDGLVGNDCNKEALFVDDSNNVWIGTSSGLSKYNPYFDKPNLRTTPVYLTGIEIFNKPISIDKFLIKPELKHDENYINFIYTGINIPNSHKTLYRYKLSGVDNDWVTSKKNNVQYTSLDDGNYTFEVKAQNEWGYWSEPASISFNINPAWWETWWFISLMGFLFTGIILNTYRNRISKLEKEAFAQIDFSRRLIISQEEERKRIAAGLHDSLGQNLLVIKNRALLALKSKKEEFKEEQLNQISETVSSTIEEVRQISYNLHPYQLSRLGLTKAIKSIITNVQTSTNIDFTDDLADISNLFDHDAEINIYRIVQENINNIIKHSEAKNAHIKITKNESSINIAITDDGKGFNHSKIYDEKKNMEGFGLENIKKRISLLKGDYSIDSRKGTKVLIKIPIKLKADERKN